MPRLTWNDVGLDVPAGTGEYRMRCPKCSPHRKPEHQRIKDLAVNLTDETYGKIASTIETRKWAGGALTPRPVTQEVLTPMCDYSIPTTTEETIESLPRSRAEARLLGVKHFYVGPCPKGHDTFRFASNGRCAECLKLGCRTYYDRHRAEQRARFRAYAKHDPEGNYRRSAAWAESHPDEQAVIIINTKAKRRGAGERITVEEWRSVLDRYGRQCICCGRRDVPIGADHVVPIGDGGRNTIDNIQPMCADCNRRKWKRTIDFRGHAS